jgi:parallel beta-helix repeat protein
VNVSSASQLSSAIGSAQPGDVIRLADGTYNGRFRPRAQGTQSQPITLCGTERAVLTDQSEDGYTLGPDGAQWWVFRGFTIDGGLKGIMADRSHDNVYENLTVKNIYGECVHMRNGSSRNTIRNNYIHHCGLHDKNGEGIYFGSGSSTGDQANDNKALYNRIEDTSAEAIETKEYTRGSVVVGNTVRRSGRQECALDGGDCSGGGGAHAVIATRGGSSVFECNDIYPISNMAGLQVYSGGASGDGDNNVFRYNRVTGGSGAISIASSQSGNQNTANTADGYASNCR